MIIFSFLTALKNSSRDVLEEIFLITHYDFLKIRDKFRIPYFTNKLLLNIIIYLTISCEKFGFTDIFPEKPKKI